MGLQAAPYIANAASNIAQKVDNVLPFGSFGDLTTTSRYKAAEKALKENRNIKRRVGDNLGGAVALGLSETQSRAKDDISQRFLKTPTDGSEEGK